MKRYNATYIPLAVFRIKCPALRRVETGILYKGVRGICIEGVLSGEY